MDQSNDVDRLFSWIKAPMVQYRDFTPKVEMAEAVATWPMVHKTAVETGVASPEETAPQGDFLAHQRIARERMAMPELAAKALHEAPLSNKVVVPEANAPRAMPSSDRLVAALGQRVQAANAERAEGVARTAPGMLHPERRGAYLTGARSSAVAAAPPTPSARAEAPPALSSAPPRTSAAPEPVLAGFEEPAALLPSPPVAGMPLRGPDPSRSYAQRDASRYAPAERGTMFGGDHRERDARLSEPEPERQDSSLGAVFDRLSGSRERLPDPRARNRTSPGLGAVFGRLR